MEIINCLNDSYQNDIKTDVLKGLTCRQKFIPCKYFYDDHGSHLFRKICNLPEYYQTRTELSILKDASSDIIGKFHEGDLIELGSGSNWKIRNLLDAVNKTGMSHIRYVPIDVSASVLVESSKELMNSYPELEVLGVVGDFTKHIQKIPLERKKLFIFFGSTIGNFTEEESEFFLKIIAGLMGPDDRFLLGIDMLKPKKTMERAYNDSKGVTSEFNKNILSILNRELKANFDPDQFKHTAFFNSGKKRVEMHLQATRNVFVDIPELDLTVEIKKDETIHTENCRKFSRESIENMVKGAGLRVEECYSDSKGWFSLVQLAVHDNRQYY
jgi:L-histidine N-alpha-methyltransferase